MPEIKKILVANRGEIALRIMRSIKEVGKKTVAIYSDADREAPHVQYADEAVWVGASPPAESYLKIEKILEACQKTGADAIHPGYGFLSENADFARAVQKANIIFIGPSPEAMATMGSKLAAKAAVARYDIPLVPGTAESVNDLATAKEAAQSIGYPVLIKASAGGGGKGMRIVNAEASLAEQLERATSEARSAFGDGSVFIEKFIVAPKHIEIQILGDMHGNIVHLFERECSIQRRYQKVMEEAPSPVLTDEIRQAMGEAAVGVAKACRYVGAGTVEFVVGHDLQFYFLEMNTRLQVEHPVTEMITGIDLVKEQISIAEGHPLPFSQQDIRMKGHAIEVRVYAEDPKNNFLPDIGTLIRYQRPQGPGVRVDDGFEQGMKIPVYYDPMIAKLIVHGSTREEAIRRMLRAIQEYEISGVATTLDFCRFVLQHPSFTSGTFDTKFVEQHFQPEFLQLPLQEKEQEIAAAFAAYFAENHRAPQANDTTELPSQWRRRRW